MTQKIPNILILNNAIARVQAYIEAAKGEVSGMGQIAEKDGNLIINKVFLFPQTTSEVKTTFDTMAYGAFIAEMMRQGEDIGSFRLWWHSHAYSNVYWSNTDEATIARLSKKKYLISLLGNKRNEFLLRYDIQVPEDIAAAVPLQILKSDGPAILRDEIAREVSVKVKFIPANEVEVKKWDS